MFDIRCLCRVGVLLLLSLSGALSGAAAVRPDAASGGGDAPARRPPSRVTFHPAPSQESPAARERRLHRECRGRPNAGACLGFARP